MHLDFWMPEVHAGRRALMVSQASGRDIVRLQCQNGPSTGAWLTTVPAASLGLEIHPAMYRLLARLWMGVPLLSNEEHFITCPFCQDAADAYGDHFLCCKKYQFHSRHQAIVGTLTHFLRSSGLTVQNEVKIGERERPADVFLNRWTAAEPAAVDVTVTHPLAPSYGLSVQAASKALKEKESRKIAKYAHIFDAVQVTFVPMAFSISAS